MPKPYSSRLEPLGDTVLVRKTSTKRGVLVAEADPETGKILASSSGTRRHSEGIVVAAGPGNYENGVFVPLPKGVKPGATVLFDAKASFQFSDVPEMAAEDLWIVSGAMILLVVHPEGMPTRKPELVH